MKYQTLPVDYVKCVLEYNTETGLFFWKERPISHFADLRAMKIWNTSYSGKEAGTLNKSFGYMQICISRNGKRYNIYAHRLAFVLIMGEWPRHEIDHVDMNRSNNKWENLREVTPSQNRCNLKAQSNNREKTKGVCRWGNRWQAYLNINGKRVFHRRFDTIEEAIFFRNYASEYHHGEYGRTT